MSQPDPASNEGSPENSGVDAFAEAMAEDTSSPLVNTTELQAKIDDLQNKLLRTQAEMENFRRRTYREQDDARKFESLRLVRDILPGMDGLNRAILSAEQTGDLQNLLNGIRMVANQFRDILKAHSAEPIDAIGKPFSAHGEALVATRRDDECIAFHDSKTRRSNQVDFSARMAQHPFHA